MPVYRRSLSNVIKSYIDRHPELPDSYRKHVYSKCAKHFNKNISKAKQAKHYRYLPPFSLIRHDIPIAVLDELEHAESLAVDHIDELDIEPLEAVLIAVAEAFNKSVN